MPLALSTAPVFTGNATTRNAAAGARRSAGTRVARVAPAVITPQLRSSAASLDALGLRAGRQQPRRRVVASVKAAASASAPTSDWPGEKTIKEETIKDTLKADIVAGISVAAVAIPQSCGYALLAGVTVKCAVMAAAASALPAALLQSSRYMHVGCISLASLLTGGALMSLGLPGGSEVYVQGASMLAIYAGITRLILGFARLGKTVAMLPECVLDGFVCAAVWLVFSSQVPAMVGAHAPYPGLHFALAAGWLITHPWTWTAPAAALAAVTFGIMFNGKKIHPLMPSALICCVLGGVLAFSGVPIGATVGGISVDVASLFPPDVLSIPKDLAMKLLLPGIAIGVSCYLEGAAVCKRWADEDGEKWNSDRELVSQGVANLMSAALGGMTVAGVISRAAFGKVAGARTRLAHGITGVIIISFIALNGGALLQFLPKAVLGALVGCGVLPLMKPSKRLIPDRGWGKLDYYARRNMVLAWSTFAITVLSAPTLDRGLLVSCLLAGVVYGAEKMFKPQLWLGPPQDRKLKTVEDTPAANVDAEGDFGASNNVVTRDGAGATNGLDKASR